MELAYNALTNEDILKEITKWYIFDYIQYPDIFLDIICNENNIYKLDWLLTNKYITFKILDKYVSEVLKPLYKINDISIPHIPINSFIEYVLLFKKSFKVFMYIFKNFETERNIILQSKILEIPEIQYHLRSNLNSFAKKMELVNIYQYLRMLPEILPRVYRDLLGKFPGIYYETCILCENDGREDIQWQNMKDKEELENIVAEFNKNSQKDNLANQNIPTGISDDDNFYSGAVPWDFRWNNNDIDSMFNTYNKCNKYRKANNLCDCPDRNCEIVIGDFSDFIKLIEV